MSRTHPRYLALVGLVLAAACHASDDVCKTATNQVLQSRPNTAEWSTVSRPLQVQELERLQASRAVNAVSITVERLSNGMTFRIVSSPAHPAIHAHSLAGAVDYIRQFATQAGAQQSLMIYLQRFPQDESLSLRQTLRVHLDRESAYFVETGPNVSPDDWPQLLKRHPLKDAATVSGAMAQPDVMVLSVALPMDQGATPANLRVTIKVSSLRDRLAQFLTRLIDRVTAVLRNLAPGADLHDTALAVQVVLERELALIEKETGLKKKDLTVQLAVEGRDIYISLFGDAPPLMQQLAMNACAEPCSTR